MQHLAVLEPILACPRLCEMFSEQSYYYSYGPFESQRPEAVQSMLALGATSRSPADAKVAVDRLPGISLQLGDLH